MDNPPDARGFHFDSKQDGARRFFRAYRFPSRSKHAQEDKGDGNDSIWAVVSGTVKTYGLTPDYVLYEMSYANVMLYSAVIPEYRSKAKGGQRRKGKKDDMVINADDPRNRDIYLKFVKSR